MPKIARTAEQKQYDELTDKMRGMCRRADLTQEKIAKLTGWSTGKVSNIVNKPGMTKLKYLRKIAFLCGYSFDIVFTEIEDKSQLK